MRKFSEQAIQELNQLPPLNIQNREQVIGFTIDSEVSEDLDDAIWIEPNNRGAIISVHIADVTAIIPKGSALDADVLERIETLYYTRPVDPMLPSELSNDQLSLLEGKTRLTVTVIITLDHDANILDTKLSLTYLSSLKKFVYEEADKAMKEPSDPFFQVLRYCDTWAQKLSWQRSQTGGFGGNSLAGMSFDEDGRPAEPQQYRSQQIIQEFMILANRVIAELAERHHLPILYRNVTPTAIAPEQKILIETLGTLGMPDLIRRKLSSWLNPATYNPHTITHIALALDAYTHFTSPIRRLADYINHRILKAVFLEHQNSPYTVEELRQIAERINQYKQQSREEANQFFEAKRHQKNEALLNKTYKLKSLSDKDFSQVIKTAAKTGRLSSIVPEVVNRLENNVLTPSDLSRLALSHSPENPLPDDLQLVLVPYFQARPTLATQVLQIASQKAGKNVDYLQEDSKLQGFLTWCIVDHLTSFSPAIGRNKQEAKHKASVLWLEQFFLNQLVNENERQLGWNPPENEPEPVIFQDDDPLEYEEINLLEGVDNPIGYLNDKLPQMGMPKPTYEYHALELQWECIATLTYEGESFTGLARGTNKKEAKHQAALALLTQLNQLIVNGE